MLLRSQARRRRLLGVAGLGVVATLLGCNGSSQQVLAGGGADTRSWDQVVKTVEKSVVRVDVNLCDGWAKGSGFVLRPGHIITNAHVVEGGTDATFDKPGGSSGSATGWSANTTEDLADVTTSDPTPPPLTLATADPVPGDQVRVVGYPLGGPLTVTSGRVIEFVDGEQYGQPGPVIRISAAIRPGNSGGPLIDSHGRVLGVVFAVQIADGVALAIPASRLSADLPGLGSMAVAPTVC